MERVQPQEKIHLPIILCLHGHGSNGAIFRLQAWRIIAELKDHFQFIFLDAPFHSPPGPGVVPIFKDMGPFWRWQCDPSVVGELGIHPSDVAREKAEVRRMLEDQIKRTYCNEGEFGVVGLMAFSQGTRVATGACLDDKISDGMRFIILIGGTFPSLDLHVSDDEQRRDISNCSILNGKPEKKVSLFRPTKGSAAPEAVVDDHNEQERSWAHHHTPLPKSSTEKKARDSTCLMKPCMCLEQRLSTINIPSFHVQGDSDPWLREGNRLRETYYNSKLATIIGFRGRHEVPNGRKEVMFIAKSVLSVWRETSIA